MVEKDFEEHAGMASVDCMTCFLHTLSRLNEAQGMATQIALHAVGVALLSELGTMAGHGCILLILQALILRASSQSFILSATNNEITVSWTVNANPAQRFEVRVPGIGTTLIGDGSQLRAGGKTEVTGLTPGFTYSIKVFTMNGITEREIFSGRETTIPGAPAVTVISKTTTTVTVAWQPDPTSVDESYKFEYQVHNSGVFIPLSSCAQYQCDLDVGGEGGSSILFRLFAVSNTKRSAPGIAVGYTKPSPPDVLSIVTRTRTSLTISWNTIGSVSYYDVSVSPPEGAAGAPSNVNQGWMYTRSGLTAGTRYIISVISNVGNVSSDAREQAFYTVPNPPQGLTRADDGATTSLAVSWRKPDVGECASVTATVTGGLSMNNLEDLTTAFSGLVPGKLYNVSVVCAVETNINSAPHSRSFYTEPLPVSNVRADRRTANSLTVNWDESAAIQEYENTMVELVEVENSLQEIPASQLGTSRTHTFSALTAGTQYTVQVYKVSGDQTSQIVSSTIITNPDSPRGLAQISQSTTSVSVSWTSVADQSTIAGYEINVVYGSSGMTTASDTNVAASSTSYQFGDLEPATQYIVSLQSYLLDNGGNRLVSDAISQTVTTDPSAPSGVTVTSRVYTALTFSWTPPAHPVENYVVSIADGNTYLIKSQVTASSSFQQSSGLKAGTTYIIEVSSRRFNRISSPTSIVVNLRPLPPRGATLVNRTTTSLTVRWTPPPSTDISQYVIEWEEDGNMESIDVTTTQHQVTGLIGGREYIINVYSLNNAGERSGTSTSITATTLPFGVTTINTESTTASSLTIIWPEPDGYVDFYEVNIRPNNGRAPLPVTITSEGPLRQTFQGLKPGFTYNVSIISVATRGGIGTPIFRMITTSPARVLNLRVSDVSTSGMKVTWGVDPVSRQASFKVTYHTEEKAATTLDLTNSTTTTGIYGLLPGRAYKINVTALMGSTRSEPATVTQTTDPLAVINLAADPVSPSEAQLRWFANVNSQQDSFQYRYKVKGSNEWTAWAGSISNTVLVNQLYPGQSYEFEVQAKSLDRTSATSAVSVTLLPLPPMETRIDARTTTAIILEWSPPASSEVAGYVAEWMAANQARRTDVKGTQLNITGLSAGVQYEINVFSKNSAGERSTVGSSVIVTTLPFGVSAINTEGESTSSLTISWPQPANSLVDRYEVTVSPNDGQISLPITVLKDGPLRQTFLNLLPGNSYNVSVYSIAADGGKGAPAFRLITTYPARVTNLAVQDSSASEMTISWDVNQGSLQDTFKVSYSSEGKGPTTIDIRSPSKSARIAGLLPGRVYTVNVTAVSNGKAGEEESLVQTTDPLPVTGFKAMATGPTEVLLSWAPNRNSKQDGYRYRQKISGTDNWTAWVAVLSSPITVIDFYPGKTYDFEIQARNSDRLSFSTSTSVTLLPLPPLNPQIMSVTATSMTVTWVPPSNSELIGYVVEWSTNNQSRRTNVYDTQLQINGLLAGEQYTINIYSRNQANARSTTYASEVGSTLPFGVSNVQTDVTSENSFTVSWSEPPNSDLEYYEIDINPAHGQDGLPVTVAKNGRLVHTFLNLKAGNSYNVSVQTVAANGGRGALVSKIVTTRPLPPHSAMLVDKSTTAVALNWSAPAGSEVLGYEVEWMVNGRPRTSEAQATVHQVSGLTAGEEYTFRIYSKNRDGKRSVGSTSVTATTYPFGVATLDTGDKSTESITVTWPEPANTNVAHYELTIDPNPASLALPVTVSGDGPLRKTFDSLLPGIMYNVTIQPVASDGGKGPPMSVAVTTARESRDLHLLKIIVPCVLGGLLLLALIIALVCYFCILRRRGASSYPDEDIGPVDAKFNSVRRRRLGDISRPIRLASLMDQYKRMSADGHIMFSDEFQDLGAVAKDMTTNAAELPVNRGKNRFTNILPFDQTRVKLTMTGEGEGSDYINANYVPGYDSKREFIACQGPLPTTKRDFWRMIWEQYACAVVMLTNCVERGREKCDHYWPVDSEPCDYGDIQVSVMNESKSPEWTITDLSISKGGTQRKLSHFHHTNWPDFGIPASPQSLVKFIRQFRSRLQPYGSPVIVHCSTGVGRTGVFLALDNLLYQVKEGNSVDVFGTVHELRLNRMAMVQTEEQYIYIYRCLAFVVEGKEDDPPPYPGKESNEIRNSIAF